MRSGDGFGMAGYAFERFNDTRDLVMLSQSTSRQKATNTGTGAIRTPKRSRRQR